MAQRRMFNKTVVNSAKFLMMPVSTRELYFELGINADDDGVVEAFNVLRLVNASEDDLKVLATKGFVQILNENLVTYITDWNSNNRIRADRKVDSIYKDLLIKILPNVELKEPKPRADTGKKSNGRPVDNQRTDKGPHRLGKVSIGKVSLVQDSIDQPTIEDEPEKEKQVGGQVDESIFQKVIDFYEKNLGFIAPIFREDFHYEFEDWIKLNTDQKEVANILCKAIKEAIGYNATNKPKYIMGILKRWRETNTTTLKAIEGSQKEFERRKEKKMNFGREPTQKERLPSWAEEGYVAEEQKSTMSDEERDELKKKLARFRKKEI
ncbi:DnaD domain protein [Liquorilactobacillus hordei]|uniref:DnaD domain protein n=1 Tax=Liquorilactobacillus hordei TaxID=468911 RepID=UPI0039E93D6C